MDLQRVLTAMLGSNWSKGSIVGAIGLIFIVLVLLVAISYAGFQWSANWQQTQQNAEHIKEYADRYVAERCGRMQPSNARECIADAYQAAQDKERDEADLYAQRQMVVWALVMAVTALISVPLSLAGIFFVWRSLSEMAAQRKISGDALNAASHANSIQQRLADADYGPRITFSVCKAEITERSVGISVVAHNTGKSPAFGITLKVDARLSDYSKDQSFPVLVHAEQREFVHEFDLPTGAKRCLVSGCFFREPWAVEEAWGKPDSVYITGRVRWDSRFGQRHERGFRFQPKKFKKMRIGSGTVWRADADMVLKYESQTDAT